ncbi:MAG: SdpI family protein [Candidatus Woesearchaeota archaeon]
MNNTKSSKKNKTKLAKQKFYDKNKLLLELIPLLIVIITFIIAFCIYPKLPQKIPIHWNALGEADGFSGKTGVFIIPVMFLIITLLLFILPLMEVFRENMVKIYKYYYAFKIIFSIFFLGLFISTLLPNFGYTVNVAYIVLIMIALLFIGLGIILPKLKRNYMFGIRTGWTLSNDEVWDKTHKLGGILFILLGIITLFLLLFFKLEVIFFVFIILTISVSLLLVLYSYYKYKNIKKDIKKNL